MYEVSAPVAVAELDRLDWLQDGRHPLDWNGPADRIFSVFSDQERNRPIIDRLERIVRRHGNRIAVTDSDTSLSFEQLWEGLSGLAEAIAADTRPGDLIGILLSPCSMFPLAILACLAAGRPFVALDPHYPGRWLGQVLEDARPALIITRKDILGAVDSGLPTARVIHLNRLPPAARKGWRPAKLGLDDPACVLFTSGSTGRPKGIVNSQRNLLQRVAQSINAAHINIEDKLLTLASLSTIVGVRDTLTALLAGARIHVLDPQSAGAREISNIVRAESISILFAFPALVRALMACGGEHAGDSLRLVRIGGDTTLWTDVDLLRAWLRPEAAIQLIYAATEAPMMQWFIDDSCRGDEARIPIGYPLPGNRLALIDEDGQCTPPGEVGELVVASPYVALGLWVDGRCTRGAMESHSDTESTPPNRLFRTGDLVRQRADGMLERIGRKDRQVKIRGARVHLDGVEAVLRSHPLVRDAAALARPRIEWNGADGEVSLVAYVSLRDRAPVGIVDHLREFMRSEPSCMRPGRFYVIPEIPRLPGSKPDLIALQALDEFNVQEERAGFAAAAIGLAGGDGIARTVARVWQEVLQMPVSGPGDDFFDAGGDSLKAVKFILGLERALGLELSLTLVTETPQFARLCEALQERGNTRYVPLVALKTGDGSPPVFFIHGLGGNVAGLLPMARRMNYPGAVIGIQARGLAEKNPPHATVEAMAAEYLTAIKQRQPDGPYNVCGYSYGGMVAFEIARQLWESGDEVALVGLFDTMMSPLRWPLRSWLSIMKDRAARWNKGGRACQGLRGFFKSKPIRVLKVEASALIASARYRPGFYPGELTLFTPREREPGFPSLPAIWRQHAGSLSIVEIAGSHWTMFSAHHAENCAAAVTRCLLARTERQLSEVI